MENKISFFQKIIRSFNPSFSKEVIKFSLKEGFKYLCLLILLITLILSLKSTRSFYFSTKNLSFRAKDFFLENFQDFPEIKMENGKISSAKDPFKKEWDIDGNKAAFVVDTKAEKKDITSGKYSSYPLGLFLLKNEANLLKAYCRAELLETSLSILLFSTVLKNLAFNGNLFSLIFPMLIFSPFKY